MKTTTQLRVWLTLISVICAIGVVSLSPLIARAELSDRELEVSIRERKRDFDRVVSQRKVALEKSAEAVASLRAARRADVTRQLEIERNYRASMKRYSMEEIEAKDRADEARLEYEAKAGEVERRSFVAKRDRRRSLETSIEPVNPYQEFEIDMKVEPESKVSHSGTTDANQQ